MVSAQQETWGVIKKSQREGRHCIPNWPFVHLAVFASLVRSLEWAGLWGCSTRWEEREEGDWTRSTGSNNSGLWAAAKVSVLCAPSLLPLCLCCTASTAAALSSLTAPLSLPLSCCCSHAPQSLERDLSRPLLPPRGHSRRVASEFSDCQEVGRVEMVLSGMERKIEFENFFKCLWVMS